MEELYNKVLCVDGSYMLHRNLHVPNLFNLENSRHEKTGGIFGFLRTLSIEIKKNGNYFPIVTFDQGQSLRRLSVDPDYKNHAQRTLTESVVLTPEEAHDDYITQYRRQRNKLMEILPLFGIPCLKFMNWEGDDLLYILSKMSKDPIVLTDDRDMLQLLSDKCRVRRPMADEMWTLESFLSDRGLNDIYDFVIYKAVEGDSSDSIPGSCKGIGSKSANEFIKLIHCFDSDFCGYPDNEDSMKELCESNNIKYKKAYLNFDIDRFIKNMELVDLGRVEVPDDIYESIKATISNCRSQSNYFKAIAMLNELEIKEFSVDELMQNVSFRYSNLFVE